MVYLNAVLYTNRGVIIIPTLLCLFSGKYLPPLLPFTFQLASRMSIRLPSSESHTLAAINLSLSSKIDRVLEVNEIY